MFAGSRRQKSAETAGSDEEDVDELSLIDHKEIMSRITLKQEVSPHCVMCPEDSQLRQVATI